MTSTPTQPEGSDRPSPPTGTGPGGVGAPSRRNSSRGATWALTGLATVGLAYVAVVDPNRPNLVPGCAFKALTGLDCPGCGGTRAVHALLHGDIANALNHNVLVVAGVLIAAVWLAWNRLAPRLGRRPLRFTMTTRWAIALLVTISAFWVLRLLPWEPFSWLGSGN